MAKREYILRYLSIINKLRGNKEATFTEINNHLRKLKDLYDEDLSISLRTFQRDIKDIRTIFSIDIKCKSNDVYYIEEEEESDINNRMLEAFDTINTLNMSDDFRKFIYFRKRKPDGTEHFYGLLHAIKNRFVTHFVYTKFWDDTPTNRIVEPYALQESQSRWYLLAKDRKDNKIKTFGLDRMSQLEFKRERFEFPKNLNVDEMFKYSFGIITAEDQKPEEIILSFEPERGKYVKSLKLHDSQEEIDGYKNEFRIKLKLKITPDFITELLKYGDSVYVVSPKKLQKQIKKAYSDALKQYQ